jgi:hypothetical protein
LLNVGLVSLGTGGGRVPAGDIADTMSVGANYKRYIRKERDRIGSHTFFPIEDIAHPASAPAAPAAELTSVLSAPPFGVLRPRVGGPSSARVVSGYSPLAERLCILNGEQTILAACSSSIWMSIATALNAWSRTVLLQIRKRVTERSKGLTFPCPPTPLQPVPRPFPQAHPHRTS